MTALLVVLMFVGFVIVDILVRLAGKRITETRERKAREAVLHTALRLDFTQEAKTLKRVEVSNPKARILAVDDEPVILDSFRKILVLAGFNVDTVENGPDALGLVQRNDYDFVFTDLKMPAMDGVEVVKAVKHLRPDIDVAVITGYATIETAVETMGHGASDYVQKPFTEDELVEFTKKLLIKRLDRLESQRRPTVRVVAPAAAETSAKHEFCVPGGAFVSAGHVWARIEASGMVRVGIDDFVRKALGSIETIQPLVKRGDRFRQGEPLFEIRRGPLSVRFCAPVSGRLSQIHDAVVSQPSLATQSPYDRGWVCILEPTDLAGELSLLRIGKPVVDWYQQEIQRLRGAKGTGDGAQDIEWAAFEREFLAPLAVSRG